MSIENIKPTGTSRPQQSGSQSASNEGGSSSTKDIGSDFASLEESKKQIRNDQATSQKSLSESNSASENTGKKANDATNVYNQSVVNEASYVSSSENAKSTASQKHLEAANLEARARGERPEVKQKLKEEAKRKELEALQKEYEAQKAINDAYEERRAASTAELSAQDLSNQSENYNNQANNLQTNINSLLVQDSAVSSKMVDAKSTQSADGSTSTAGANYIFSGPTSRDGSSSVATNYIFQGPVSGTAPPGELVGIAERTGGAGSTAMSNSFGGTENSSFGFGPAAGFIAAARAILKGVMRNTLAPRSTNPTELLGMHRSNKTLYDLAISVLDAGQTQLALSGEVANQDLIFLRTQATAGKGETETSIQYWQQMQEQNKQAQKDTHDHARRA